MGLKTNAVGGAIAINPMVRIWDTRHGGEVARFRPQGAMLVVFSPVDDLAATLSESASGEVNSGAAGEPQHGRRLELWRLSAPQVEVAREQPVFDVGMTKLPGAREKQALLSALSRPPVYIPRETVWVGADRKLRMLDTQTRRVVVLDDLGPVADAAFADAKESVKKLMATVDRDRQKEIENAGIAVNPYARSANQERTFLPEFPISLYPNPIALSGDRQRALVKLASTLRSYALDEKRLIATTKIGDEVPMGAAESLIMPAELIVSHNGSAIAAVVTTLADAARGMRHNGAADGSGDRLATAPGYTRHVFVLSFESNARVGMVEQKIIVWPMGGLQVTNRPLAISDNGRLLALERQSLEHGSGKSSGPKTRIVVLDPRTGETRFQTPSRDLAPPFQQALLEIPEAAAFSSGGRYLVVDQTQTACPRKLDVLPSLLPIFVPSCSDWRTTLRLWDVAAGTRISEISFDAIAWQPAVPPAASASASGASATPALPPPRASLALVNDEMVVRTLRSSILRCDRPI